VTLRGKPLALVLSVALLFILSLRALTWMLGDLLFDEGFLRSGEAVLHLAIFAVSLTGGVGLLLARAWARWLALALCSSYSLLLLGVVIVGVLRLGLGGIDPGRALASVLEAVVVAGACWWYLTRPEVRVVFERPPA
jgi:hypothetical protein